MDDYFLYLPVYYAINQKFFSFFDDLSETYQLQQPKPPSSGEKTDRAVFDCLVKNSKVEPEKYSLP